jgi:hypothetical protein
LASGRTTLGVHSAILNLARTHVAAYETARAPPLLCGRLCEGLYRGRRGKPAQTWWPVTSFAVVVGLRREMTFSA